MDLTPVTLAGDVVHLAPLRLEHVDGLWEAGRDPELWRLTVSRVASRDDMRRYVESALAEQAAGTALPFATLLASTGEIVGSTRFGNIAPAHRRVEIGWTWIAPAHQRSAVNTAAKYLMLRHAFEVWGCMRVELKTNVLNARSRAAMLRIGAIEEGVLRKHALSGDGTPRDSVYYSILDDEWPAVRARLEMLLARPVHALSAS